MLPATLTMLAMAACMSTMAMNVSFAMSAKPFYTAGYTYYVALLDISSTALLCIRLSHTELLLSQFRS